MALQIAMSFQARQLDCRSTSGGGAVLDVKLSGGGEMELFLDPQLLIDLVRLASLRLSEQTRSTEQG